MEDAYGRVNLDYYPVVITKLPAVNNKKITATELLEYVRLHINDFVDTKLSDFEPFQEYDAKKWNLDDPDGALVLINVKLVAGVTDYALVVATQSSSNEWRFSTVRGGSGYTAINDRNKPGAHPVSGNRAFGFYGDSAPWTFYTIGADRATRDLDEFWGMPGARDLGYSEADKLWRSFQAKLVEFVNTHEGEAKVNTASTVSKRYDWNTIKNTESVFDPSNQPAWVPVPPAN